MTKEATAPPRERNRRGEGGLLRDEILRAALALLDETGDATAVSLRAVARRAGISAPSIYRHFASPEAILLVVVQDELEELHGVLRAAADVAGQGAEDRLRAWCVAYLAHARERPERYLLVFGGVWNVRRAVEESALSGADVAGLGTELLDELADLLRASGRAAGPADAAVLWVGLHGLAHQRIVATAFDWPPGVEDRLLERLLRQ